MAQPNIGRMGPAQWLMLITLSVIWGGSFFFNEIALRGLPPFMVVWGRIVTGAIGLTLMVAASGIDVRPHLHQWKHFLVIGILNTFVPFSFIVWGQQHIDSGLASVINATTPAFTILVANFFTSDERASVRKFTGAAIGLGGVATLIGSDALSGFGDHILGQGAVMCAALSYACSATYARRIVGMPPLLMACGQLSLVSLVMTPVVFTICRPWELPMPSAEVIGAVFGLGLVCSALAYILFFRILTSAGATNVQLVTLFIPFSASSLGIVFLGEPFSWRLAAGIVIVSTAALLIDGRLRLRRS